MTAACLAKFTILLLKFAHNSEYRIFIYLGIMYYFLDKKGAKKCLTVTKKEQMLVARAVKSSNQKVKFSDI